MRLCFYCGREGLFLAQCPETSKTQRCQLTGTMQVHQTSLTSRPTDCGQLRGILQWAQNSLPVHTFLESGSESQTWLLRPTFLLFLSPSPGKFLSLMAIFLVRVTHMTSPVILTLSGNHQESLQLDHCSRQNHRRRSSLIMFLIDSPP